MNTVKTRKVGNSVTVTIPKTLNVPEGQEMFVYKGVDNVIVLAPKFQTHLVVTLTYAWKMTSRG